MIQSPRTPAELEAAVRDYELLLARIIYRHGRGRDLTLTIEQARRLLARHSRLSALRGQNG